MNPLEKFFFIFKEKINKELAIPVEELRQVEDFPHFLVGLSNKDQIRVLKLIRMAWDAVFKAA